MNDFFAVFEQMESTLGSLETIFGGITAILTAISTGISIIIAIFTFIVTIIVTIIQAIPLYTLAKKAGSKFAWLAWCPIFNSEARLFVMCDIAGNLPFDFWNGKVKFQNRKMMFLAHICIKYFGNTLILAFIAVASILIPVIGTISSLLILLPSIACNLIYYVFFRDILNLFNEDKKANVSTAIIVCVIDAILLCGLARTCYFYTLMKKQPLPVKEVVMDENVVTEFVTVSENMPEK